MLKYNTRNKAVLLLQDGTSYNGLSIGAQGISSGEICFNTTMTGYQETYTDPSYLGQIMVATTPHIGNYGITTNEIESDGIKIAGLVCNKFTSSSYSRIRATGSLQELFEQQNISGISDIDTRSLVRHIRNKGAMNAIISSEILDKHELSEMLKKVPSMDGLELSSRVSTNVAYDFGSKDASLRVAVLDLGVKRNILRCLEERGCYLRVFPMDASIKEMLEFNPNGFMLTNGPGDPSVMTETIAKVKEILSLNIPVFGICLGHQIIALSSGLRTYKMHNGHRGVNHPVKNLITGKCEVTSQNHGFVVNMDDAKKSNEIEITHVHLNDNTLAGLRFKNKHVFSVQYHPESSAGPNDSRYLFDEFVVNMKKTK